MPPSNKLRITETAQRIVHRLTERKKDPAFAPNLLRVAAARAAGEGFKSPAEEAEEAALGEGLTLSNHRIQASQPAFWLEIGPAVLS